MATITFDSIQSGGQTSPTYTYTESGFTFEPFQSSAVGGRVFGVTNNGDGSFVYNSNSLTFDNGNAQFDTGMIRASDGSRFTPTSVQLNQLRPTSEASSITFTGNRNGTAVAFQQFSVDNDPNTIQTVNLGSFLSDIDTLTVQMGTGARQIQLDNFVINPVCFVTGTRILTSRGEVAVEALAVGDLAVTASGAERAIRWIGHRTIDCRGAAEPHHVMPVRIAAGALGEGRPARELSVSPGHLICLDVLGELLVPAAVLVNGATIVQETVASVTYWHVELDSHDILLAEGQPAESYLDVGNRGFFAGSAVVSLAARPDGAPAGHDGFCRPVHGDGVLIDAVRSRLQERALALGWRLDAAPLAGLHLEIDGERLEPVVDGLTARFALPAAARDVFIVSEVSVPRHILLNEDSRRLGVCLRDLSIAGGATRAIALDDARLVEGFHAVQPGHRWTAGRARLPAALFADCAGGATLRIALATPALIRWVAPEPAADIAQAA